MELKTSQINHFKVIVYCFISENIFGSFKLLSGRLTGKIHFLETIIDGISIAQGHRLMLFITESGLAKLLCLPYSTWLNKQKRGFPFSFEDMSQDCYRHLN